MKKLLLSIIILALIGTQVGAATFGYTSVGGSSQMFSQDNDLFCTPGNAASSGVVNSVSVYSFKNPLNANWKGVIVASTTKNILTNGISDSGLKNSNTPQWWTNTYSSKPSVISGTDYYVCIIEDQWPYLYYDSSSHYIYDSSNSYNSPSNPTDFSVAANKLSIYATYDVVTTQRPNSSLNINNGTVNINNGTLNLR